MKIYLVLEYYSATKPPEVRIYSTKEAATSFLVDQILRAKAAGQGEYTDDEIDAMIKRSFHIEEKTLTRKGGFDV